MKIVVAVTLLTLAYTGLIYFAHLKGLFEKRARRLDESFEKAKEKL
jgi:hypothetical protein